MSDAQIIADCYIRTWNEVDESRRRTLLSQHWAVDASYVDPMARASGQNDISTLIAGVHARFPGFAFKLLDGANGHGDHLRFSWSLGPEGVDAPIEGSDVVTTVNGKIAQVIGFLDKLPQ